MPKKPTLAIIEDNVDLQEELVFFLGSKGYSCWTAENAEVFWKKLHLQKADIFLIDIGLPGEDGFSLISHLSKLGNFGLIIITARGGKQDYLQGLNLGADLYLVKPVNFADLNEKIEALWQRISINRLEAKSERTKDLLNKPIKKESGWLLDATNSSLIDPVGNKLLVTQQEKELLEVMLNEPNQVISRLFIDKQLFKHHEDQDIHRVNVIISRLRKKAREQGFNFPIRSVFGKGLVFIVDE
ncbi:MAG: response regulator transcription factor [Pseudomonadaceae bacterium]|nr:response regulator transcription factor [Pseudomonadaceae bacterium]